MQCPNCSFENTDSSIYCEQCGTPLKDSSPFVAQETAYQAPPPPPLNGHQTIFPPPSEYDTPPPPYGQAPPPIPEYSYGMEPQIYTYEKAVPPPHIGIFSGLLYFMGIFIAEIGLLGTLGSFGSSASIGGLVLLFSLVLLIASIVTFILMRRRIPALRRWQRIAWILGATVAALIAFVIVAVLFSKSSTVGFFASAVILLYGLIWAAIAVW